MILHTWKRTASGVLASAFGLLLFIPLLFVRGNTDSALSYLETKSQNAWSIMALTVNGRTIDPISLKAIDSTKAIDYEAPIMALVAAGKDPASYASLDYVAKLKSFFDGTQLGDAALLNDDIFGILALKAAGMSNTESIITGLKNFIVSHQNADGGFSFLTTGTSDTNTTAAAIMALRAAGNSVSDLTVEKAVAYLRQSQNDDGGFPYDPKSSWGTESDGASDAWVIMALTAVNIDPSSFTKAGKSVVLHLMSLQAEQGYYKYQSASTEDSFSAVTTAYAVLALTGKTLPAAAFAKQAYPHVSYRIAGSSEDLCVGETEAPNAFELVKIVSVSCGFDYHVTEYSFGKYLDRIGTDSANGNKGWMYRINFTEPSVGAEAYILKNDDAVLWYFDDFNSKIARISLNPSHVSVGTPISATVEYYDAGEWKKLANATIHAKNYTAATDATGSATLSLGEGHYNVFATAQGFLRTEQDKVIVGAKSESSLSLSVDLGGTLSVPPPPQSDTISFTLSGPGGNSDVGFGKISRGTNEKRSITVQNNGANAIYMESIITGDPVFTAYMRVDGLPWREYSSEIEAKKSKDLELGLTVPTDYNGTGVKTGQLTVWATRSN